VPRQVDAVPRIPVFVHFTCRKFAGVLHLREERPFYLYEFGPLNAGLDRREPTGEEEGLGG
jgi:hypothetical protein